MKVIETIGNKDLKDRRKTLFLCSKRTPIDWYAHIFNWVDGLTDRDCIVCFNSTELETEVVKALLVNRIPTVLVVMNKFRDVNNAQIEQAICENRMLIIVLKRDEPAGKGLTPRLRNEFVLGMAQEVVCGYLSKNGSVFSILAGRKNVEYIRNEAQFVAEEEKTGPRWSVADDKILLRMFYEDMGIHAIHKRLRRSYISIRHRVRSLTMPEDVLKGREFEDYVLELFNIRDGGSLILKEWRGDKILGDICPENNHYPDFIFSHQHKTGKYMFAVECKWRQRLPDDFIVNIFPADKIAHYQDFSKEHRMPVFFMLGIGGEPCEPERLYFIPINEIGRVVSGEKTLNRFRHIPSDNFLSTVLRWRKQP